MRTPLTLTLACLLAAAVLLLPAALAQDETGVGRARLKRTGDEELGRSFRSYERMSLDTADAAARVRRTGRLSLKTGRRTFDLELEPHDMRASNYRAEATVAPGVTLPVASGPVRTYKGKARGAWGAAEARFTIDDESFEGVILSKGERYYVEPAGRYTREAAGTDFLLYRASDVIETESLSCAADSLHDKLGEASGVVGKEPSVAAALSGGGPSPQALVTPLEAELATEADYEYFRALGGSAAAANSEILSIMNQVEGLYQNEIGLSFKIVYQHVWATTADPYTTVDPVSAIKEFTAEWNNDPHAVGFDNVVRDVAHMWTGKNLTGTAGVAWTGSVCKVSLSRSDYALSELIDHSPQKFILPAHEIGHSFNAAHSDGVTGCAGTVMQAVATDTSVFSFCQSSRDVITRYITANSSCLSQTLACSSSISPTSASFTAAGGSDFLSLTASNAACDWGVTSTVPWIQITTGATGTGSARIAYTVDPNNTTVSRKGTIMAAGRTFTVTQAAGGACTFSMSPTTASYAATGGAGSVAVTAGANCAWRAVSNVTWLHISNGTSGTGNGTVSYTVDASKATTSRQGTLTIAGKTFTVTQAAPPPVLSTLVVNPPTVVGGCQGATGTVTLTGAAPAGGTVVALSDNLAATTLPASVTIPAGARSKAFTISTAAVSVNQSGTVTAQQGNVIKTDTLTVRRIGVRAVSVRLNPIVGGTSATGTVSLECPAAPAGITVALSDNIAATTLPANITIPAGVTSKTFPITSVPVSVNQSGTLTATANGVGKSLAVTVRRIGVLSVTVTPNPVTAGQRATATVRLERAAAPGNIVVTLASGNTLIATVPSSITFAAGTSSKTFTVTTKPVVAATSVTISATANGVTKRAVLAVNP